MGMNFWLSEKVKFHIFNHVKCKRFRNLLTTSSDLVFGKTGGKTGGLKIYVKRSSSFSAPPHSLHAFP